MQGFYFLKSGVVKVVLILGLISDCAVLLPYKKKNKPKRRFIAAALRTCRKPYKKFRISCLWHRPIHEYKGKHKFDSVQIICTKPVLIKYSVLICHRWI